MSKENFNRRTFLNASLSTAAAASATLGANGTVKGSGNGTIDASGKVPMESGMAAGRSVFIENHKPKAPKTTRPIAKIFEMRIQFSSPQACSRPLGISIINMHTQDTRPAEVGDPRGSHTKPTAEPSQGGSIRSVSARPMTTVAPEDDPLPGFRP